MTTTLKSADTYWCRIYMTGSVADAKRVIREHVFGIGQTPEVPGGCVTVEPTSFIYDGGEEEGFVVGLVNYPRFPTTPEDLFIQARILAGKLQRGLFQSSVLIMTPEKTEWLTTRKP